MVHKIFVIEVDLSFLPSFLFVCFFTYLFYFSLCREELKKCRDNIESLEKQIEDIQKQITDAENCQNM